MSGARITIKAFIKGILDDLSKLEGQDDIPSDINVLVKIESKLTLKALKIYLEQISSASQSDSDLLNNDKIAVLINTLTNRWTAIQNTDAVYCHAPGTIGNRACMIVAEHLVKALGKKKHPYEYLIPNINVEEWKTSKGNLSHLKLHEFIMSDNNEPIDVMSAFKSIDSTQTIPCYTNKDNQKIFLTTAEKVRLLHHSQNSHNCYYSLATSGKDSRRELQEHLDEKSGPYTFRVLSTYGQSGKDKLLNQLLKTIDNFDSLVGMLKSHVDKKNWRPFLLEIDKKRLAQIILNTKSLPDKFDEFNAKVHELIGKNVVQKDNYYRESESSTAWDDDVNRVVLFCYTHLYKRVREDEPEYTTLGGYFGGHSRSDKVLGATVLENFFASDEGLMHIDNFINNSKELKGRDYAKQAISQRELGLITDQARKLSGLPVEEKKYYFF